MKNIYIVRIYDEGVRSGEYEFWNRALAETMYESAEIASMFELKNGKLYEMANK